MRLMAEDGGRQWLSPADYAASLRPEDWEEATWPCQQGGHTVYVHSVRTWVRKLGPTLVWITRLSLNDPVEKARFWGSTLVDADAQTVIDILAIRWDIEVFFEDIKDLLGADHYQLMGATAIIRFWTLVFCWLLSWTNTGPTSSKRDLRSTSPSAMRAETPQADHQRNLLIWLEKQFRSGATAEQLYAHLLA